jgi:glycosyltransferase involved in cell wall biosynthesis
MRATNLNRPVRLAEDKSHLESETAAAERNGATREKLVFFIHTPKDPKTAVFGCTRLRADELRSYGYESEIVAPEDFKWLRGIGGRWYTLLYAWAVAHYLFQHRNRITIAIFHSHAGWAFHFLRAYFPSLQHIRTVTQFHGLEPLAHQALSLEGKKLSMRYRLMQGFLARLLIRASCRRSDQIQCLNSREREYLVSHRWAQASRVVLYVNGVPQSMFLPLRHTRRPRKIVFLGQWIPRKGVHVLIPAFARARETVPDLELLCVGTVKDESAVRKLIPDCLQEAVQILPKVPHEEISAHLTSADMFVLPSLYEGSSIALIEAMAAALPIITTSVGLAIDQLQDGVSALVIPINDSSALAHAIERIAHDPEMSARLGKKAYDIAQGFENSAVCARYHKLLCGIPARRGRHSKEDRESRVS